MKNHTDRIFLILLAFAAITTQLAAQTAPIPPSATQNTTGTVMVISSQTSTSLAEPNGRTSAYRMENHKQLLPGQLADSYFGDYVLENAMAKFVFAAPGRIIAAENRGGLLIDASITNKPMDYLNYMTTLGDVTSTESQFVYDQVEHSTTPDNKLAQVAARGHSLLAEGTTISIETIYSLAADENVLNIVTSLTNTTNDPVEVLPVDRVDWGSVNLFTEKFGFNSTTATVHYALSTQDDYSLGYINSGDGAMEGAHGGRDSLVMGWGKLDVAEQAFQERSLRGSRSAAASTLGGETEEPLATLVPGSETMYNVRVQGYMVQMPRDVLPEPHKSYVQKLEAGAQSSKPSNNSIKLSLAPGESYSFKRKLVLSDNNWAAITETAYLEHNIPLGSIAGVVNEFGSNTPIADAEVLISEVPAGASSPARAVTKTVARADGTFAVKVPAGRYVVAAANLGRISTRQPGPVDVIANQRPQVLVLSLTKQSKLRIAISEAETPTSSPLPVKVTLISKPGTPPLNYGFDKDVLGGVRNTRYLPYGAEIFPVTPGRYQLVVSRGMEYDVLRADIDLKPEQEFTFTGSLPHVLKDATRGYISMDAGIMTSASAKAIPTAEDRAVQAACEGLPVIISGDFHELTDFQAAIQRMNLEKWVKGFNGSRFLIESSDLHAEILVYPLDRDSFTKISATIEEMAGMPPDTVLAELKKLYPDQLIEIVRAMDSNSGYFSRLPYDEEEKEFWGSSVPPADFDAVQIVDGKRLGSYEDLYPRYMDVQIMRTAPGAPPRLPITPTGGSNSTLPYGEELGSPRIYLRTANSTIDTLKPEDIVSAIRSQRIIGTNGPFMVFEALDLNTGLWDKLPGDVMDQSTSEVIRLRTRIYAAPWVSLSGIQLKVNGGAELAVGNIEPNQRTLRYPLSQDAERNVFTRYLDKDSMIEGICFSNRTSLAPVIPDLAPEFGGAVYPFAWTGPIFVDRDGDGSVDLERLKSPYLQRPELEALTNTGSTTETARQEIQ